MTSIRNLLTLFITLISINLASAQQGQVPADERASTATRKLKVEYQLSDEQTIKVHEITLANIIAYDNLKKKKASQQELDAQEVVYMNQLKDIFTPEQYQKAVANYEKIKASRQK